MSLKTLRIFISSPGDVGQERLIATRILEELQGEFSGHLKLEPILWEHEPLRASSHFQEQIVPPSQTDIVICILWSRLGTRLPEQFRREDGSRYQSGTEWEFEDALRAFHEHGTPDLMVYRKTAEPQASLSDEQALMQRLEQKRALDIFIDHWFGNPLDSFRAAFHTFDSSDQFEELLKTHLRSLLQMRLPQHLVSGDPSPLARAWHKGSPFRGLESFDVEHAPIFFGRARTVSEIKNFLCEQANGKRAFILVFGMSGSGKSSLVRAGVLPAIMQPGGVAGVGTWRRSVFRPSEGGGCLFRAMSQALLRQEALPELGASGLDVEQLATLLEEAPESADVIVKMGLQKVDEIAQHGNSSGKAASNLVVVIDQLEEIWTLEQVDDEKRRHFIQMLSVLAHCGSVWVIATMSSDFYARCAEIPELVRLKEGVGQYDLLRPSFAEIGQMIRQPARAAGVRFEKDPQTEESLDEILHEAASRAPEALPLLEFTLAQLFEQADDGLLTLKSYHQLGGLEGALAQRAEDTFAALPLDVQAALPIVLQKLVAVKHGDENVVVAQRVPLSDVATTPAAKNLLDAFMSARLLVRDRAADGTAIVEVAHEALLRHWPRLQQWLEQNREFLRHRERVAEAAARWQEESRAIDYLLPAGKPLVEAEDLLVQRRHDLPQDLIHYVEMSQRSYIHARRKANLKIAGIISVFFVSISTFATISYKQWQVAEHEKAIAIQQKRLALEGISKLPYDLLPQMAHLPGLAPVLRREFKENIILIDRIGDPMATREKAVLLAAIGDLWLVEKKPAKALESYEEARSIHETLARISHIPETSQDLKVINDKIKMVDSSLRLKEVYARHHYVDLYVPTQSGATLMP